MHEREILHENMSLVAGNNLSTRAATFMTKFHLAMASRSDVLAEWRLLGLMTFGMAGRTLATEWNLSCVSMT